MDAKSGGSVVKKIMLVFGTRPEAIKMCPLIKELDKSSKFQTVVCVTGQHRAMLDQVLDVFKIKPDYDLNLMKAGQTLSDVTSDVLDALTPILRQEKPNLVLVHGDTTTTYAAALSSFYEQIPVGHIEAGLRTYNLKSPYPEEFNRRSVSLIADYHFAPTKSAASNLVNEGIKESKIFVTGNTAIDALRFTVKDDYSNEILSEAKGKKLILITAHRRENLGEPMRQMFKAIKRVIDERDDCLAVYPVHLNPKVQEIVSEILGNDDKIKLIPPLPVLDFQNLLAKSYLVLTDSGGIQEEAPSLGVPVLVMRDTTERPEGIEAGTLKLVGTKEDTIYQNCKLLLEDKTIYEQMTTAVNPYGDGFTSQKITKILEEKLS